MARSKKESAWETRPARPIRRGFGWGRAILLLLLGLLVLLWFAPAIVVSTSLKDSLLGYATHDVPGRVTIQSASAGWLSPLRAQKITVVDRDSVEIATVESFETQKTLLSLVMNTTQLGAIRITQPHIHLIVRDDGSNVEDFLQPFLKQEDSGRSLGCSLEIVGGKISARSATKSGDGTIDWTVANLDAKIQLPADSMSALSALIKADVAAGAQPPGKFELVAEVPGRGIRTTKEPVRLLGKIGVKAESFPLEITHPWLQRAVAGAQLRGSFSTDVSVDLKDDSQSLSIQQIAVKNLMVAAPAWLDTDVVQLASLSGKGNVERAKGTLQVRGLSLASELGAVEVNGTVPATNNVLASAEILSLLRSATGQLRGKFDVARLANVLPRTLRIREGTHVAAGEIAVDISSQLPASGGQQWTGRLEAKDFSAVHQGRQIQWRQPIVAQAAIRGDSQSWSIDQLTCVSSFLNLSGKGTLDQGQLTADAKLEQFISEIGQFVDVGGLRAAGQVQGNINWKRQGELREKISLSGNLTANNLDVATASTQPWRESRLDVNFAATGQTTGNRVTQLDAAQFSIQSAGDKLTAELREPVASINSATAWPVRVSMQGDVGQWLTRMQLFYQLPGWQIDGDKLDVSGEGIASAQRIQLEKLKASVTNFVAVGPQFFVREPTLEIEFTGAFDRTNGEFTSELATLAGTAVALRADRLRLRPTSGTQAFTLEGDLQYRADLERLSGWLQNPQQPAPYRVVGAASGATHFSMDGSIARTDLTADVQDFSLSNRTPASGSTVPVGPARPWTEVWREPRLQLAMKASYDAAGDRIQLERFETAGESFSVGAAGELVQPFSRAEANLTGQYAYDLEKLGEHLRGLLGPRVAISGTGTQPFSIRGPLLTAFAAPAENVNRLSAAAKSPATGAVSGIKDLFAEVNLEVANASFSGVTAGPIKIQSRLDNGTLFVASNEARVGDGVIQFASRTDVTKSPSMVSITPGTIVDQVRISPEICRAWLKYVAPLVADATAAEGRFSVELKDALFPADNVAGGNVEGTLRVQSARIGPGPLAQEMLALVQEVRALIDRRPASADRSSANWLDIPQQEITLQLADQRVYHRNLQMQVKDIVIRTQGWVGLDQQLAMVVEVPVRDEWIGQDRIAASLRGQSIKLPLYGTLSKPQIDRRALPELAKQTIRDAGANFLQDQLNRGLDRLLPKPPAQPQR